jgi:hypothetical protein
LTADGTLTGTPDTVGTYTFSVVASNVAGSASAGPFTVSIAAPNHAPDAVSQSVSLNQNTSVPITLSAVDQDGDPLTYAIGTGPAHGSLSGTAPNLTYTPAAGYVGSDSFMFTAADGHLTSQPGVVSITVNKVNHAPVASDVAVSTTTSTAVGVALSASDPDGDALAYSVVANPSHGTLTGTAPNLTYTPAAQFTGTDSFTYKAFDGALDSNVATATVTVAAPAGCSTIAPTQDMMVSTDQRTPVNALVSPAFTTSKAGELLIAYVSADGGTKPQSVATMTGAGLTWKLVSRSNTNGGTTEVWKAMASAVVVKAKITATLAHGGYDGLITVAAYQNASGIGSSSAAGAIRGAPSATLRPTGCNSRVVAVGHDYSHATAPAPVTGQTIAHQVLDTRAGDSFWIQQATAMTTAALPVTMADLIPTKDIWQLVAVEILGR